MENNSTSRREAIRYMGFLSAAMCLLPMVSCNEEKTSEKVGVTAFKTPLPFLIPPQSELDVGILGSNMRTLIRSEQTSQQFSCVEAVLAPKKIAGSPHKHDIV